MAALREDDGDEVRQLDALAQLSELLSISSEESLAAFPVEAVVPLLVRGLASRPSPPLPHHLPCPQDCT